MGLKPGERERDINSMKSIQVFVNKCLRNILGIRWLDTISNSILWRKTIKQQPVETTIGTYRWNWLGHTLRKPNTNTTRQSLGVESTRTLKARKSKEHLA